MEAGYYSQDFMFFDDILKEKNRQGCDLITKELQRRLDKSTQIALQIVLEKLSEHKKSKEKNLIEKGRITDRQTYKIPFSLELLINEMNGKADPIDLIDVAIKKRKERGNKAFRTLLRDYDNEMRKKSPNTLKLAKREDELDQVVGDLKKDSSCKLSTEKTAHYLSNLGRKILEIAIRVKSGDFSVIKETPNVVINSLELLNSYIYFPHRAYIQKLGTADITVFDKLEVDRVFGEQGKEFASILRYYSVVGKKADEILKMKRK